MPGLFSRLKNFVFEETIRSSEVNAELNNIINNLVPAKIDNYSQTVTQMQIQTDPGAVGTEVLAPALSGELERFRYVIARLQGTSLWYTAPAITLAETSTTISQLFGLPSSRVIAGLKRTGTQSPGYLVAAGATNSVTLQASPTDPFQCYINNTLYTFTANITFSGLATAPIVDNTALIDDATFAGESWTRYVGEDNFPIKITAAGTEVSTRTGESVAFLNSNTGNEIFKARVASGTKLTDCYRGYYYDSTSFPIVRDVLNNTDVITILRATWVFLTTQGVLDVCYRSPFYGGMAPAAPSVGDYWYDTSAQLWKKYDGSVFQTANAVLVGECVQDSTNCIASRPAEFFNNYQDKTDMMLEFSNTSQVATTKSYGTANVYGREFNFQQKLFWNYPTDLDSGVSSSTDTTYFFYLTEEGKFKISDVKPYNRFHDLRGWYHPYKSWLCVGGIYRDTLGAFDKYQVMSFGAMKESDCVSDVAHRFNNHEQDNTDNGVPGYVLAGANNGVDELTLGVRRDLFFRLFSVMRAPLGIAGFDGTTNASVLPNTEWMAIDVEGTFLRGRTQSTVRDPDFATRSVYYPASAVGGNVGSYQAGQIESHNHALYYDSTTSGNSTTVSLGVTQNGPGGAMMVNTGGNQTNPINLYVQMYIKY